MRYIIVQPARPRPVLMNQPAEGYAFNSPIEGWIWTLVQGHATRFETEQQAAEAAQQHYPEGDRYEIRAVPAS